MWPTHLRSSRSVSADGGRKAANSDRAARRRRLATRMSCNSSLSSPSRVPGSLARRAANWRRITASPTRPIGSSASIEVEPNATGTVLRPAARAPASYFVSVAGCSRHAFCNRSTNGRNAANAASGALISTRCSRVAAPPAAGLIAISSSMISPEEAPLPPLRADGDGYGLRTVGAPSCCRLPRGPARRLGRRSPQAVQGPRLEPLGNLMSTPLAGRIGPARVQLLHRRLGTHALPAPGSTNRQRVARAVETAVIRVEIDLDLAGATYRIDPDREALGPLGKLVEPTNHWPEIDRVELPHHVRCLDHNPSLCFGSRWPRAA